MCKLANFNRDAYNSDNEIIAEFIHTRECAMYNNNQIVGITIQHSEYNDSTYDRNYHHLYTCLIVWF